METRKIELTLEQAKSLYKQGGNFRTLALGAYTEEELTKPNLPKSWNEFEKNYGTQIALGEPLSSQVDTFICLIQLRDCYRQGWKPNWKEKSTPKFFITSEQNEVICGCTTDCSFWLSFETPLIRDIFLGYFRDMIEQVKEFI